MSLCSSKVQTSYPLATVLPLLLLDICKKIKQCYNLKKYILTFKEKHINFVTVDIYCISFCHIPIFVHFMEIVEPST